MDSGSVFGSVLAFVAVIAAIPAALWLLKRTPVGGAGAGQKTMRAVGVLPLSASQRIVTVEVGSGEERRWLVLGVTPGSVTTLHTMAPQAEAAPPSAPGPVGPAFAQLLKKVRRDA